MATFDWAESAASQMEEEPRVQTVSYGDGYTERAPDGLNPIPETWNLQFRGVSKAAGDEIVAFFRAHKGCINFDWTPPFSATPGKWICQRWTRALGEDFNLSDINATFKRDFRP